MKRKNIPAPAPFAVVVNDDPTQLSLLAAFLRKAGLEPRVFSGAEDALEAMAQAVCGRHETETAIPALIVTDLYMPGIDGWRFCRLLRSPEYTFLNQVPIMVVSATFSGDEAYRIASDLGASSFLAAPVDGERFIEEVHEILQGRTVQPILRALIVDDHTDYCDLLKTGFAHHGYQADTARTVKDAFELFARTAYDVIVLDHHLPDGEGGSLLEKFRTVRHDCVCLMITGDSDAKLALEWMKKGAAAYLRKPFETTYLVECCNRARRERALLRAEDLLDMRTRELKESEERYRTVADFTHDWEYWLTPDGSLPYVSPSCERLSGYRAEEYQQDPELLVRIVHPEDRDRMAAHIHDHNAATDEADFAELEFRIQTRDGQERWISHVCRKVYDPQGKYLGRRAGNRDVTDRKRAQEEQEKLEAQNRQLQKMESLNRMAGSIAHLFNNHLQVALTNLELAQHQMSVDTPATAVEEFLAYSADAIERAAEVSGLMLTYLGQTPTKRESVDLSQICKYSLSLLTAIKPPRTTIEADFPFSDLRVHANANQIQQALTNLVANAFEAVSEAGGCVHLSLKMACTDTISAVNRFPLDFKQENRAYAELAVGDDGCGIAPAEIEKIFDPYYSSKFTGRGMGLAVVLGIVRMHGGLITVESRAGQGSVFKVYLPLCEMEAVQKKHPVNQPVKASDGGTLLVIDDEPMVLKAARMTLNRAGFETLTATSGTEGLEVLKNHRERIRCVLCDVTMPDMSGWVTLQAIRKLAPGIPFILASGYSEAQVMAGASGFDEHPNAFLSKPYKSKDLKEAINQAMAVL